MTALLPVADRRRLVGILGRLASDHDGERAAAGLLATRLLKAHGITWEQVVGGTPAAASWRDELRYRRPSEPQAEPWRGTVQRCLARTDLLTSRELEFLQSITRWTGYLRPKQAGWLERIAAKVDAAGAGA